MALYATCKPLKRPLPAYTHIHRYIRTWNGWSWNWVKFVSAFSAFICRMYSSESLTGRLTFRLHRTLMCQTALQSAGEINHQVTNLSLGARLLDLGEHPTLRFFISTDNFWIHPGCKQFECDDVPPTLPCVAQRRNRHHELRDQFSSL